MSTQPHHDDDQAKKPDDEAKQPATPIPNMSLDQEEPREVEEVIEAEEIPVVEAAPDSAVEAMAEPEEVLAEDVVEVTGSSVVTAPSDVQAAGSGAQPRVETPPRPESAAPASSDVISQRGEEPAPSETPSDVDWREVFGESAPAAADSPPHPPASLEAAAAEEIARATPTPDEGEPLVFEEAVAETVPAPDALADEAAHEIAETAPDSTVAAAEEVLGDDAFGESAAPSDMKSDEIAQEAVEAAEEVSSATMKAEAVLDDEIAEAAEAVSGEDVLEEAEPASAFADEEEPVSAVSAVEAEEVFGFDEDEAEAVETGSSAVVFDEPIDADADLPGGPKTPGSKTSQFDATVSFEPPASSSKKADDALVADAEEVEDADDSSAVDLGGLASHKAPPLSGIDKVAEALESGVDLDAEDLDQADRKLPGSVVFDELLDDEPTEVDAEAAAEAALVDDDEAPAGKKGKKITSARKKTKATGDDIDLGDLFGEDEAAKPADAAEAEPVEMFDEEAEAAAALAGAEAETRADDDEKPVKKAKKGLKTALEDEADEAKAVEDDEEDYSAKKKKKKKDKEKATVAPPPSTSGGMGRVLVGMGLAVVLLGMVGAGALFFAPDQIIDVARMTGGKPEPAPVKPPQPVVKTDLEKAQAAIAAKDYKDAIDTLANAGSPEELSVRGEAKWLAYYKQQTDKKAPVDANAPELKAAIADLTQAKNDLLLAQINATLGAKGLADQLQKAIADKKDADQKLVLATTGKNDAEKKLDAVADTLVQGKFIAAKANFDAAALAKVLKNLGDDRAKLDAVNQILAKEVKTTDAPGLLEVLKLKQSLADRVAEVDKALAAEKAKEKGAKGVLELAAARDKNAKDRDALAHSIADALKELGAGNDLMKAAKLARLKAESPLAIPLAQLGLSLGKIGSGAGKTIEQSFDTAKLVTELAYFKGREEFIETPDQKMNTYMILLGDRQQKDAKKLAAITREADWVLSPEAKADAESRGKARFVQGLVLRNQEKFAEARTAIGESLTIAKAVPKAGVWGQFARKALDELTDPHAYYLPRIEKFRGEEKYNDALDEANTAIKALPAEPILYAQRGLVRLDLIAGKGPKTPDAAQQAIRADADAAKKDAKLAGESAYLVGLLEEELRNWPEAEKQFRAALKLAEDGKASADDEGKYRVALARILLRDRPEGAAAPAPAPAQKNGAARDVPSRVIVMHPWTTLVVSSLIAQNPFDPIETPETLARLNEAIGEANKLIASKNPKLQGEGYLARGKALSKLGKRTEGLKDYSDGLKLIYPGIRTEELKELIDNHPAFQQPDVSDTPNPVMAERHFGEGIHLYWSNRHSEAEAQFRQALKYFDRDARYQYYLGLALLGQRTRAKRDAAVYAFEQGALIEAKNASTNPLVVREVNASLERIQGELRQYLNTFRYKATPGSEPPPNVAPK